MGCIFEYGPFPDHQCRVAPIGVMYVHIYRVLFLSFMSYSTGCD